MPVSNEGRKIIRQRNRGMSRTTGRRKGRIPGHMSGQVPTKEETSWSATCSAKPTFMLPSRASLRSPPLFDADCDAREDDGLHLSPYEADDEEDDGAGRDPPVDSRGRHDLPPRPPPLLSMIPPTSLQRPSHQQSADPLLPNVRELHPPEDPLEGKGSKKTQVTRGNFLESYFPAWHATWASRALLSFKIITLLRSSLYNLRSL